MNNRKIEMGHSLRALLMLMLLIIAGCDNGTPLEVIDANGDLVEIPDTLTGNDGSYQVTLPEGTALPVIIRVTPPSGEPLLNIVPEPEEGTNKIVANINPITNLVAETVLGDVDETDATDLGAALTTADTTTVDEVGDEVVEKILGSNVDYDTFSSDENFTANDGENSGSAADAILDTIAKNAEEDGVTMEEQFNTLADEEDPPKLLEDPSFQIELVSEIVQGGTDSADIEGELAEIGALGEEVKGEPDVLRTIIEVVPVVIEETIAGSEELGDNEALKDIAVNAAVDLLVEVVEQKEERFEATDEELEDLLSSDSLKDTVVEVVTEVVVPMLETFTD